MCNMSENAYTIVRVFVRLYDYITCYRIIEVRETISDEVINNLPQLDMLAAS